MRFSRLAALSALSLTLSACGGASDSDQPGGDGGGDKVEVLTSSYPLEFAIQRVGGDHVSVRNLTKPGADPHDLELAPRDVASLKDADLVFYAKGFQPAMDDAVTQSGQDSARDVSGTARLTLTTSNEIGSAGDPHDHEHGSTPSETNHDESHEDEGHDEGHDEGQEEEGHEGHDHDHDHGGVDPHFWLDTARYSDVAAYIAAELAAKDPAHKADYEANAKALAADLSTLDTEFKAGLATCASRDVVTGHAAFGYLTQRYDLTQTGVVGISGGTEVSPSRLAEIATFVKEHGVKTIYLEVLLSPENAQTIAQETGAQTARLDPLEGLTDESAGDDYFEVMRANLEALKTGQSCS